MTNKLSKIVTINTGFSFRGPIAYLKDGGTYIVQASDLSDNGTIILNKLNTIQCPTGSSNALLNTGDIVLVSRGTGMRGFRAALVDDVTNTLLATSTLIVIHPSKTSIIPEYLLIYLNSNKGQAELSRIAIGSSIKIISIKELGNLLIPLPSLTKQRKIVKISKNIQEQKTLSKKREALLSKVQTSVIQQIIN